MKYWAALVALLAACCLAGAAGEAAAVTPVEKVIALLSRLETQLQQEGKDEAAAYDKYACFCKEQVDDKLYAIERSTAKIAKLDAKIEKLGGEISALDGEISGLGTKIGELDGEMTTAQGVRDGEHATFLKELADADGAIAAGEGAIQALEDSKEGMGGKTELEAASLAQIKAVATTALAFAARTDFSERELSQVNSLLAASQPGKAYEYSYHSNDILATIESLLGKFKKTKTELEQDEFDANAAFEKRQLSMANEKKFAEKEKMEKEALAESKREEKASAEGDRTQESNDKTADESFMAVLTGECEMKAKLWDQRSQSRSQELTAISEAMSALKSGVAPNYKANKKLVGLQKSTQASNTVPSGHWVYVEDAAASPHAASFLQLRGRGMHGSVHRGSAASQSAAVSKVHELLMNSARRLGSSVLSAAALKVSVADDHFVKVRQIIKDLVARLEADAKAEKSQKSWCDDSMKAAVTKRDTEQSKAEDAKAQISSKEAQKSQLEDEIVQLSKEIAALKKALMEATELREEESAENQKTINEAGAGKEAVQTALQVLTAYYQSSLLQRSSYVPPKSDREASTVGDLAPDVFDAEYEGAQQASKGIIGLLEVILSDFDRTVETVTSEENTAAGAFEEYEKGNKADTIAKEGSVKEKEGLISDIKADLVTLTDDLKKAEENHADALAELDVLHKDCVAGEETYDERVGNRQKEIAALKEAHTILEDWKS